jgi:hypothetical protein
LIYQQDDEKKSWPCDTCGAILSTKYNLIRHQARERKRIGDFGSIPTEQQQQQEPQFEAWDVQFPAKRTSTDAKFRTPVYPKRFSREPSGSAVTFQGWE